MPESTVRFKTVYELLDKIKQREQENARMNEIIEIATKEMLAGITSMREARHMIEHLRKELAHD